MKRLILALDHKINGAVVVASAVALGGAATLAMYQVVTRFILLQPSTWSEAVTRLLLIWMVYLASVALFRQGALISMSILEQLLTGRSRFIVQLIGAVASAALLCVLLWYGIDMAYRVRHQVIGSLGISIVWGYAAIPVGAAFSLLAILARSLELREVQEDSRGGAEI